MHHLPVRWRTGVEKQGVLMAVMVAVGNREGNQPPSGREIPSPGTRARSTGLEYRSNHEALGPAVAEPHGSHPPTHGASRLDVGAVHCGSRAAVRTMWSHPPSRAHPRHEDCRWRWTHNEAAARTPTTSRRWKVNWSTTKLRPRNSILNSIAAP